MFVLILNLRAVLYGALRDLESTILVDGLHANGILNPFLDRLVVLHGSHALTELFIQLLVQRFLILRGHSFPGSPLLNQSMISFLCEGFRCCQSLLCLSLLFLFLFLFLLMLGFLLRGFQVFEDLGGHINVDAR